MPSRTISILSISAGALLVLYLFLVGATVYFVSQETRFTLSLHTTESAITSLESNYYEAIAKVNAQDPSVLGLVAPKVVEYVSAAPRTALSSARN